MVRILAYCFGAMLCAGAIPIDTARVVSLNPGLTDVMLELELADRLIAVSDYCTVPDDRELTRVGTELTPNTEALLASRPSHVLTGQSLRKQLTLLGNTIHLGLPLTTTAEVRGTIKTLGITFHRKNEATRLLVRLDAALHQGVERYSRVLVVAGVSQHKIPQLYLMNPQSLHGDLLGAADSSSFHRH